MLLQQLFKVTLSSKVTPYYGKSRDGARDKCKNKSWDESRDGSRDKSKDGSRQARD